MKFLKNISIPMMIFSSFILVMLFLNLVLDMHPVLSLFKYLESEKYYWTIPSTLLFIAFLWFFDKSMRRKIINERVGMFNATIRTIQDLLQNSSSSMQLLIMDMHDEGVSKEIVTKAEKNIDELKGVIEVLASIDPNTIKLQELNRNLSIIRIDKKNDANGKQK